MTRKIGESHYEVAEGIIVMPIYGSDDRRDGWQVIVNGEYDQDFRLKRQAVAYAKTLVKNPPSV